ncbi:MAG: hypothetical protein ACEPO8_15285 [Rhodothermaceae bacterium]
MSKLKKKTTVPLFVAVLLIWGVIGMRVFEYFTSKDEAKTEVIKQTFTGKKRVSTQEIKFIKFERDVKDPFRLQKTYKPNPKRKKVKQTQPKKVKPQLNFAVKGVIINAKSKMVIIEDLTDRSTHFLKEREPYKTIKIVKITNKEITYLENKKKMVKKL